MKTHSVKFSVYIVKYDAILKITSHRELCVTLPVCKHHSWYLQQDVLYTKFMWCYFNEKVTMQKMNWNLMAAEL